MKAGSKIEQENDLINGLESGKQRLKSGSKHCEIGKQGPWEERAARAVKAGSKDHGKNTVNGP